MNTKIKAIIVDDEAPARRLIYSFLNSFEEIEVVCECTDGFEGAKKVNEWKPDLIFLDIQMPRINGIEMLELLDEEHLPLTIFTTAYDDYAIKSFEYNTCDYLLKPIAQDRFDKAVKKALNRLAAKESTTGNLRALMESGISEQSFLERIVIRSGSQIQVVHSEDVICLEASDDYVIVHTKQEQWVKKQTLKYFETRMNPDFFLRVHRSFVVNITCIARLEAYSKDAYIAILNNGLKVSVSKAGYTKLRETLSF